MRDWNFRTGPFLKVEGGAPNDWMKYIYLPKTGEEPEDVELNRRWIGGDVEDHFSKAQDQFFKSLKREVDVSHSISRTTATHLGQEYTVPYLWANNRAIIRQATMSDYSTLIRILNEARRQSGSSATNVYFKKVIEKGLLIVVTDYFRNTIKGLQTLAVRKNDKTGKNMLSAEVCLYIEEDFRGMGIFRKIFEMIFEAAAYACYDTVYIQCAETNPVAEKYEHLGFKRLEEKITENLLVDGKIVPTTCIGFEKEILLKGHATFF